MHLPKNHWSPTCSRFQFKKKIQNCREYGTSTVDREKYPMYKGGSEQVATSRWK